MATCKGIAVLGFPESGKTTYLAALYATSQSGDSTAVRIATLPPNTQYLDAAVANLESLQPMPHTPSGRYHAIDLSLFLDEGTEAFGFALPDVSGEEFDGQWERRQASDEVLELYSSADAFFVFVHCRVPIEPLITDAHDILGTRPPPDEQDVNAPYEAHATPIGVKLVEIVQQAVLRQPEQRRVKVAIIASAWDVELANGKGARTPKNWLQDDLPLLWQYLSSNEERIEFEVFGVSAQGGAYETDSAKLEQETPSRRPIVQWRGEPTHDISEPLRWAIGI